MQSGRGGGLTETFSGVESIFGTKTNVFLVRGTVILSVIFLITSLSLSYLSKKRGESLLQNEITSKQAPRTITIPKEETKTTTETAKQASEPTKPAQEAAVVPAAATVTPESVTVTPTPPIPQDIEKTGQETKQQ